MKQSMLICTACLALFGLNQCDNTTKDRITTLAETGMDGILKKLEKQVDQGDLALTRFDRAYTNASKKLIALKTLKADALSNMERAQAKVKEYEAAGNTSLAQKNRQQAEFFEKQYNSYDETLVRRAKKLKELKQKREELFEDVHLLRERIAYLESMRDALSEEDTQSVLRDAESRIAEVQHRCNELSAEVELLNDIDQI